MGHLAPPAGYYWATHVQSTKNKTVGHLVNYEVSLNHFRGTQVVKLSKVKLTSLSLETHNILHHLNNSRHALRQHSHIDITDTNAPVTHQAKFNGIKNLVTYYNYISV